MQMTRDAAEKRLSDLGIPDMPLTLVPATPTPIPQDWFIRYKETCRKFATSLTDSVDILAFMVSQDEFMDLIMGRAIGKNLSIRLRVPLMWDGKLDISNMFLCRTFPYSHNMDRFILEQSGADELWLPDPAKKVYMPIDTFGGGDGGNATEDRMSQIAAQMAASNTMG